MFNLSKAYDSNRFSRDVAVLPSPAANHTASHSTACKMHCTASNRHAWHLLEHSCNLVYKSCTAASHGLRKVQPLGFPPEGKPQRKGVGASRS